MPGTSTTSDPLLRDQVQAAVAQALAAQPIIDMHTHLYPPGFGTPVPSADAGVDPSGLMLWGVDELLTYHYLVAEVYRVVPASRLPYEQFWKMSKTQQADHIWQHLFLERTPISEACRGVVTALTKLGLDPSDKDLGRMRRWFAQQIPGKYIDRVMELSNVSSITMTNAVFDDEERRRWLAGSASLADPRFRAVLRIDPMLRDWSEAGPKLAAWGYDVGTELSQRTLEEARRFLRDWIDRMKAIYLAVSLPPEFRHPVGESPVATERAGQVILDQVVLPVCAERGLPFAMMIGSRRWVNPALRDAGDMGGQADVGAVTSLCSRFPGNKFFVTMLARENQHELCVAARKFGNLMIFGCWWFLNNPSLIEEITRMRIELLGASIIPQHSDARVLDQLLYKWDHSVRAIGPVLADKYRDLIDAGWPVTRDDLASDVRRLVRDNFNDFLTQ